MSEHIPRGPQGIDEPAITALVSARTTGWIVLAGLIGIDVLVIVHTTISLLPASSHPTRALCPVKLTDQRHTEGTILWVTFAGALVTATAAVLWGERAVRAGQLATAVALAGALFAAAFTGFGMSISGLTILAAATHACGGG